MERHSYILASAWHTTQAYLAIGQRQAVVQVAHPDHVLVLQQAARRTPLARGRAMGRHLSPT